MKDVKDLVKLQMLLPFIARVLDGSETRLNDIEISEMLMMVADSFNATTVKDLNSDNSQIWPVLLRYAKYIIPFGQYVTLVVFQQ